MAAAAAVLAAACNLPFGIGLPSTTQLINGATDQLAKATSFEIAGSLTSGSDQVKFDAQFTAPSTLHMTRKVNGLDVEVIQIGGASYYRGKDYVTSVVGTNAVGQALTKYIGDTRWITSKAATPIDMSPLTNANQVKANFLSTLDMKRSDHVTVDGVDTAELSDSGSILNISESSPYQLIRLRTPAGKTVDGIKDLDIDFSNYGKAFGTAAPAAVFSLDDAATWPPYYTVSSISLERCSGDPCTVSVTVANQGGTSSGSAPSTVTATLTNDAGGAVLGTCKAPITPDAPHGQSKAVTCTVTGGAWKTFVQQGGNFHAAATIDNPAFD